MAKYRLTSDSTKTVNCDILNESADQYVVRFKNGVVRGVDKKNVSDFNKIDEAVLDRIRDFSQRAGETIRKGVEAVKGLVLRIIKAGDFIFFGNGDDKILNAVHPINAMAMAKASDVIIAYSPSESVVDLCDENGISPVVVEDYEAFSGDEDYHGSILGVNDVNESCTSPRIFEAGFNYDEKGFLSGKEKINLHGGFDDANDIELAKYVINEYKQRYKGNQVTTAHFIWGAPGIGKTAMTNTIKEMIKEKYGAAPSVIAINGGNLGPDDLTFPAVITREILSNGISDKNADNLTNGAKRADELPSNLKPSDKYEESDVETQMGVSQNSQQRVGLSPKIIKDLPKTWLPVYDDFDASNEEDFEALDAIANGGKVTRNPDGTLHIENGPGGIFFIDEFSRATDATMAALMQTPTTRMIGQHGLHFGSRWVILCAANRKSEMSRAIAKRALQWETASATRFVHYNYVPRPEAWFKWALSDDKYNNGNSNVLPEIVAYVKSSVSKNPKTLGDYYEMARLTSGDETQLNKDMSRACPRSWEMFSDKIYQDYIDTDFEEDRVRSISELPKEVVLKVGGATIGVNPAKRLYEYVHEFAKFTYDDAVAIATTPSNQELKLSLFEKHGGVTTDMAYLMLTDHIMPLIIQATKDANGGKMTKDMLINIVKFLRLYSVDKNSGIAQEHIMTKGADKLQELTGIKLGVPDGDSDPLLPAHALWNKIIAKVQQDFEDMKKSINTR